MYKVAFSKLKCAVINRNSEFIMFSCLYVCRNERAVV